MRKVKFKWGRDTYKLPSKNVTHKPTFILLPAFNPQIIGSGKTSIIKSVTIFGNPAHICIALGLRTQSGSAIVTSQNEDTGRQAKAVIGARIRMYSTKIAARM